MVDSENSSSSASLGKSLRSRANRRSLSGAPLTYLFETKFQHFKAFQRNQNNSRGLNSLLSPPSGALYRSSMPVTPISTPIASQSLKFTEQTLRNRILNRSLSPRRAMWSPLDDSDMREDQESQSLAPSIPSSTKDTVSESTVRNGSDIMLGSDVSVAPPQASSKPVLEPAVEPAPDPSSESTLVPTPESLSKPEPELVSELTPKAEVESELKNAETSTTNAMKSGESEQKFTQQATISSNQAKSSKPNGKSQRQRRRNR